jgi:two-component system KDP operon response regulator KdpE
MPRRKTTRRYSAPETSKSISKKRVVLVGGAEIHLTRVEFDLLQVLVRHAEQVVTHGQLLKQVWGPDHEDQLHYLRVYMLQLRRELEADPARPKYLRTEAGVGYRLVTEHLPISWSRN